MNRILRFFWVIVLIFFVIISCNTKKPSDNAADEDPTNLANSERGDRMPQAEQTKKDKVVVQSPPMIAEIKKDTLLGRWLRPDGNYVIQINSINSDNVIDAEYFNPRPINIARAEIIADDNLRVFIEFDDRGYEGSSYDLIYDPENDALTGKYFQATYGQTYQIAFIRMNE